MLSVSLVILSAPSVAWAEEWVVRAHVKTPDCASWDGTCQMDVEITPAPDSPMETRQDCMIALAQFVAVSEENGLIVDGYCELQP